MPCGAGPGGLNAADEFQVWNDAGTCPVFCLSSNDLKTGMLIGDRGKDTGCPVHIGWLPRSTRLRQNGGESLARFAAKLRTDIAFAVVDDKGAGTFYANSRISTGKF